MNVLDEVSRRAGPCSDSREDRPDPGRVELSDHEVAVLHRVVRELRLDREQPLRGHRVVAVQHVQRSLLGLVDALCRAGVRPRDVTVVGKSYSTNPAVLEVLLARGVQVEDPLGMTDPGRSYEVELAERTGAALRRVGTGSPTVVLDEGGVATRAISRHGLGRPDLVVVEQTTRGVRWSASATLEVPVVDVARSAGKTGEETPLITRSMKSGLDRALHDLGREPGGRVLLVGYGVIGRSFAALLRAAGRRVAVVESREAAVATARHDGFDPVSLRDGLAASDLVVGCTGSVILRSDDLLAHPPGAVFANGASSDIEYAFWPERQPSHLLPGTDADPTQPWRNHYRLSSDPGSVLLAGGFPVNFYGSVEPIPAGEFQITRALMLVGAVQASREAGRRRGVVPLDVAAQAVVVEAYRAWAGQSRSDQS